MTIIDLQHDDIKVAEKWVKGLRSFLGQSEEEANMFVARLHKEPPTPKDSPKNKKKPPETSQPKETIIIAGESDKLDKMDSTGLYYEDLRETSRQMRQRDPHTMHIHGASEIAPAWVAPVMYVPHDEYSSNPDIRTLQVKMNDAHAQLENLRLGNTRASFDPTETSKDRLFDLNEEMMRMKLEVERLEALDKEAYKPSRNCLTTFVAYCIHFLSVLILLLCTFPWTSMLICSRKERKPPHLWHLSEIVLSFSFLANTFLLFGPLHFWESTDTLDHHMISELAVFTIAFIWLLIHIRCCGNSKGEHYAQKVLLYSCCIRSPHGVFSKPNLFDHEDPEQLKTCCGLVTEENLYFLRLTSTLAFLIAFSGGLFFALACELWLLVGMFSPWQLGGFGLAFALVWFFFLRLFCHSLVMTFGNHLKDNPYEPLLIDHDHSQASVSFFTHAESEPP